MTASSSPFDILSAEDRARLRPASLPRSGEPMKAKLTAERFDRPDWIYERKLDGVRALATKDQGKVRLVSRTGHAFPQYPEIAEALEADPTPDFVADGEIVAFDGEQTSFSKLQGRLGLHDPEEARRTGIEVFIYLFDLLYLDGADLTGLPLLARKTLLRTALRFVGPIRYTEHRQGDGLKFYAEACTSGWEGLIAKRADSTYERTRSGDWLKFRCVHGQELVIAGYTPPHGSRTHFGALLVGYYEGDDLVYAGRVGTGFSERILADLGAQLTAREITDRPFTQGDNFPRDAHWVRPELVGEFGFSEWTTDGKLRHPRYLGLREDKPARDVVRETPDA